MTETKEWWRTTVDGMARDFTSIGNRPTKSQVQGRVIALLEEQRRRTVEAAIRELQKLKSGTVLDDLIPDVVAALKSLDEKV